WDVSEVVYIQRMFRNAVSFNQDISSWNVSKVEEMEYMFDGASSFNQNLGDWNITSINGVNYMKNILNNTNISSINYDSTLIGWASQEAPSDINLGTVNTTYCAGEAARDTLANKYKWTFDDDGRYCVAESYFTTTWKTDNTGTSGDTEISIQTLGSYSYNYDVDWNNDGVFDELGITGNVTHDYGVAGTYTINIRGTFPCMYFNNGADKEKIISIDQWGTIAWASFENAFYGCKNMTYNAIDAPDLSSVTSMKNAFLSCSKFNGDLSSWDVSNINNFTSMFQRSGFNGNVSTWDMSEAENLFNMFYFTPFNQDISSWNVSNVTNMNSVFKNNYSFNQDISGWDVSSVTTMSQMFKNNVSFNQDISGWDVSNVESMIEMFWSCSKFDQDLSSWQIDNVMYMTNMFKYVSLSQTNYDNLLISWAAQSPQEGVTFSGGNSKYCQGTTSRNVLIDDYGWVITDNGENCDSTDYFVTTWLTTNSSGPIDRDEILISTNPSYTYFYDVDWDNDGVFDTLGVIGDFSHEYGTEGEYTIQIRGKFPAIYVNNAGYKAKLVSLDQWGTISWEDMEAAFYGCSNMISNATDAPDLTKVSSLESTFNECTLFNGDVSNWDVSNITTLNYTFSNATSFDQDLSSWDITLVGNAIGMLDGVTLSIDNYDALLEGWSQQAITKDYNFSAGNSKYCNSSDARDTLEVKYGWSITDGGAESIAPTPDETSLADVIADCEVTSLTPPTATDNCSDTVYAMHNAVLPITTEGVTEVTWTFTDANGNTSTQTQNVIIGDVTAPVPDVDTLDDVLAECEITELATTYATDACFGQVAGTHNATLPITKQGTTVITWTYEDDQGNTSTQTQNVIIEDVTAPVAENETLSDIEAECEVTSLTPPTAIDNCNETITGSHDASLPITTIGTTVITWTYNDGNGNTSTQTQNVIIEDITKPSITCIENFDVDIPGDLYTVQGVELDPTETFDNCKIASVKNNINDLETLAGEELLPGTHTIVWTIIDASGNSASSSIEVSISKKTNIHELKLPGIKVYPNPVSDYFTINTNQCLKIKIYDELGQIVRVALTNEQIPMQDLPQGLYFLRIENYHRVFKVIKQ
ncbi:MAG: BspA family leucine-rich repeat surface protein, partial [Bacteroidales bacterium]|nr:BspA family leucine-rich repeat surface protein [Bacteroidales bacterium]